MSEQEHITRGDICEALRRLGMLQPVQFTKERVYAALRPVVDALEKDLGKTPKSTLSKKGNKEN